MRHAVRISDGLGNQMFQYAFAYALQKKTGDEVLIDPLFWGTSLRRYDLDKFNISMDKRMVSTTLDYILGAGPRNGRKFKNLYREHLIKQKYELINEKEIMSYDASMLEPTKNSFYFGFWQTPCYFDKYRDEIKKEFIRKTKLGDKASDYLNTVQNCNSVSVHIRRTDYVRESGNAALSMDYYDKAIETVMNSNPAARFFIFTDDKEYARNKFEGLRAELIEGISDLDELEVMRNCRHHIIANSTYSWWGAYLSAVEGMVVAPFVGIWKKDFYPDNWIKIDAQVQ